MIKSKRYKQTQFSASDLRKVTQKLGADCELRFSNIEANNITVSYDSLENFFNDYGKGFSQANLIIASKTASITVQIFSDQSDIKIDSQDPTIVDSFISIFDSLALSAKLPESQKGIDVTWYCKENPLHWESLPLLHTRLKEMGITITNHSITIRRYPTTVTYTEWAPVIADIRQNGEPNQFEIHFYGSQSYQKFSLSISKSYNVHSEKYLCIQINGVPDKKSADDIALFLSLEADEATSPSKLERTAFIAHSFNQEGEQLADRLARFLILLGFEVKTGRGFSPQSVGGKVKQRLKKQSVVFILLTPADNETWLIQESVLGYATEKPLFLLRDIKVNYKPGILGDHEYIQFTAPMIESTFIPILEGLSELGFFERLHG